MKLRDYVLEQIAHRETRPVPFTLGFEGDVAERLDAHYGGQAWRKRLTPFMHWTGIVSTDPREPAGEGRERDAYGGIWRTDRRPWHLEKTPLEGPTLDGYDFPAPERFIHLDWKDAAVKSCEEHADRFRVAGMGWGLFEMSWRMRGFENALMDAMVEQDFYEELLDRLTDLYLKFVEVTADIPVDAVFFGDDWGDQRGVILGPERWRKFLKPRWARIYEAVHASGKLAMSHCCGSVADIMPDITEIGLDVLESVQPEARGMSPYELKAKWGDRITFWGGLGSQSTIPHGTPPQIAAEVRRLCREMGRGGGYMLAPAKSLQPETPTENAVAVVEAFTNQEG